MVSRVGRVDRVGLGGSEDCGRAGRATLPTGDVTVGRVVGPSDPLGRVGLEVKLPLFDFD